MTNPPDAIEESWQELNIDDLPDDRYTNPKEPKIEKPAVDEFDDLKLLGIAGLIAIVVIQATVIIILSLTLWFR
jgi:hypothetical protein